MSQSHLLLYKTEDGQWVPIPSSVLNVYEAYVQYCNEKSITPVSKEIYYNNLSNLENYVTELQKLLGNLDNLEELTASLKNGVLPTNLGGTGTAYQSFDALVAAIYSYANIGQSFNNVQLSLNDLQDNKFDSVNINSGTEAPTDATRGVYYFQYTV